MNVTKKIALFLVSACLLAPLQSRAEDHTINAEARQFNPDVLYIQPGDTINFINMATGGHDSKSVDGFIPEGAQPWDSGVGQNLSIKLDVPGIYLYVCVPHLGFGMVGAVVVGKPSAADVDAVMERAQKDLQGPYRRLLGKLLKVKAAASQS